MQQEDSIEQLINILAKLPGLGKRSARRAVLHLINRKEQLMYPLAKSIEKVANDIVFCDVCYNIDTCSPCNICSDPRRDKSVLCIVEEVSDLWAIERGDIFKGCFHVLGGTLSALDGRGPDELNISNLLERAKQEGVQEVIIATNNTVEGQTTAHYITELFKGSDIKTSRIAQGIPMGGEIDYLDDGTLRTALDSRVLF